jgi:hypothetical protein
VYKKDGSSMEKYMYMNQELDTIYIRDLKTEKIKKKWIKKLSEVLDS